MTSRHFGPVPKQGDAPAEERYISELIFDILQSPNFVSGSTGLKLDSAGNAEFNDVTIRGTVILGAGSEVDWSYVINQAIDQADFASGYTAVKQGSANPADNTDGNVFYNTTDGLFYYWDGSKWTDEMQATSLLGQITSAQITDLAVTEAKVAANAVTTAKIAADAVTAAEIAAGAVGTTEIAALAVTSAEVAASAITTAKIAADAVTSAELAASAVGSSELAAGAVIAGKIAAGTIVAADIAAGTITSNELAANSVTATQLAANSVTAADMLANTITAAQIAAGTITTSEIAADTITAANIAANTVTAAEIAALTITASELAADSVTSDKILASAVTTVKLDANAVTAAKIEATLALEVGQLIRSTTYTPGSAGWAINADGTAEFASVIIRGDVFGNWDGGTDLSGGPDTSATTGYFLDGDAGAAQFEDLYVGGYSGSGGGALTLGGGLTWEQAVAANSPMVARYWDNTTPTRANIAQVGFIFGAGGGYKIEGLDSGGMDFVVVPNSNYGINGAMRISSSTQDISFFDQGGNTLLMWDESDDRWESANKDWLFGSNVFIDVSTNRIGVGTTSPSYPIHVVQSGNAILYFDASASAQAYFDRGNTSSYAFANYSTAGVAKWRVGMTNDATHDYHIGTTPAVPVITLEHSSKNIEFPAFATEALKWVDAGSTGATEQDWIEVTVGGTTGYIRVFASK